MFPFTGVQTIGEAVPGVPLLPVRFRKRGAPWSQAVNAVLDTGSTRCLLRPDLARALGIDASPDSEELKGAGGPFRAASTTCDVRIVDAHFPDATFWELVDLEVWVPVDEKALEITILGWDLLRLFDMTISHRKGRIDLTSALHPSRPVQGPHG